MVQDSYFLPPRKARLCRRFGIVFLIAAAFWAAGTVTGMVAPGLRVVCDVPKPCMTTIDPVVMLTEDERAMVARAPDIHTAVDAWAARPWVRVGLAVLGLLEDGPIAIVLLGVGLALRRMGARGDHVLVRAVPWLKNAARAGVFWAIATIFTHGLRSFLLSPGLGKLQFPIDLTNVPLPLLLAVAAYASAWALEAGIRAERDLGAFV